ncbi:MAG: hypothetical protein LBN04_10915, partial [Oscillospiraceae bacterium]|nr:hypothetical protein [Oscillospiraceae bacterium]
GCVSLWRRLRCSKASSGWPCAGLRWIGFRGRGGNAGALPQTPLKDVSYEGGRRPTSDSDCPTEAAGRLAKSDSSESPKRTQPAKRDGRQEQSPSVPSRCR